MSLGHTFSSTLHYTGPVTSSATPIKAIQAKGWASPCFFVFFPSSGADEIYYKAPQPRFLVCFATSVHLCWMLNYWIRMNEANESQHSWLEYGLYSQRGLKIILNTNPTGSTLSAVHSERPKTQKITLCRAVCQDVQDASCLPLWNTSKLWAADNFGAPRPGSCHVDSRPCSTS